MKNHSKEHIDVIRAQVLDKAMISSRLLDERYFDKVAIAVKDNKESDFNEICTEVAIPKDMRPILWQMARKTYTDTVYAENW